MNRLGPRQLIIPCGKGISLGLVTPRTPLLTKLGQTHAPSAILDAGPRQRRIEEITPIEEDGARLEFLRKHFKRLGGAGGVNVGPDRGGLQAELVMAFE